MGNIEKKYELDPDTCTLTVNYLEPTWDIGEEKVRQDLVYNTIAAMASIDNLAAVTYEFPGDTFSFTREQVEEVRVRFSDDMMPSSITKEGCPYEHNGSTHFIVSNFCGTILYRYS